MGYKIGQLWEEYVNAKIEHSIRPSELQLIIMETRMIELNYEHEKLERDLISQGINDITKIEIIFKELLCSEFRLSINNNERERYIDFITLQ